MHSRGERCAGVQVASWRLQRSAGILGKGTVWKGRGVNFLFVCGWCDAECVVWGKPTGFWRELYTLPDEWDCWWCDGTNITPPPPWNEA
jgi:hypothetical protein